MSNLSFATKVVDRVVYRCVQVSPACITYLRPDIHHTAEVTQLRQRCCACISYELSIATLSPLLLCWAFDTVDHSTLLAVIHRRFGVLESAMNWFLAYLSDLLCQ